MELLALPAFTDNYIWMVHDGQDALVVDPGEAAPVIHALRQHGLKLRAILVTHRHADHVGGISELKQVLQGPIYGPSSLAPIYIDRPVAEGDVVKFGELHFEVWHTPGHTNEHLSYVCHSFPFEPPFETGHAPLLFCGDVIFSAGCGRIFEGEPKSLFESLNRFAQLPDQTRMCPTHEYTLSNLAFAQAAEPGNSALKTYLEHCQHLRAGHLPTLPTTLSIERQVNPYLRLTEPEIISSALRHGAASDQPLAVFTAIRAWKNTF